MGVANAQGNYEIQVYGADTVPSKNLMVGLHSNFTPAGQRYLIDGVYPTNHQEHETIELTEGINGWSEVGFYIFTSEQGGHGVQWVGDHIRPRVRFPDSWHWPVGFSISTEIGYQRAVYSPDTWTWEIRPIVDKTIGHWYFAINPALERTWHGPDVNRGLGFAPGVKVSYDLRQPEVGDQRRNWGWSHSSYRPPDREGYSWSSLRLGETFSCRVMPQAIGESRGRIKDSSSGDLQHFLFSSS